MASIIAAVIFDIGGVWIQDPADSMNQYCAEQLGVDKEDFEEVFSWFEEDFQLGRLSEDGFLEKACSEFRKPMPRIPLWSYAVRNAYIPNQGVISLAQRLKDSGTKIGLLSNTELPFVSYHRKHDYPMVDVSVFSCMNGCRKPGEEIFEVAVKRLGVMHREALVLDDQPENVQGALDAGLYAELFKDAAQAEELMRGYHLLE